MCTHVKIATNEKGQISQCNYCQSLEIIFLSSIIQLSSDQITHFIEYIGNVAQKHSNDYLYNKHVILHLGGNNPLQMYLTVEDLFEFQNLLEDADVEIKAQAMMRLFKNIQ